MCRRQLGDRLRGQSVAGGPPLAAAANTFAVARHFLTSWLAVVVRAHSSGRFINIRHGGGSVSAACQFDFRKPDPTRLGSLERVLTRALDSPAHCDRHFFTVAVAVGRKRTRRHTRTHKRTNWRARNKSFWLTALLAARVCRIDDGRESIGGLEAPARAPRPVAAGAGPKGERARRARPGGRPPA
jgi:hypothetical protein